MTSNIGCCFKLLILNEMVVLQCILMIIKGIANHNHECKIAIIFSCIKIIIIVRVILN